MGKITVVDIVLRLLGAVIVGFAVGAQRARTSHPAGIRTHILVALGSCVVMVTSCIMYEQTIAVFGTTPSDPARLGAQVINGIGFLGAGTILVTGRQQVKGLTTAAGLWASACTGLAVGAGFYECVLIAFAMIFLSIRLFPIVDAYIQENARDINLYMEFYSLGDISTIINQLFEGIFKTITSFNSDFIVAVTNDCKLTSIREIFLDIFSCIFTCISTKF